MKGSPSIPESSIKKFVILITLNRCHTFKEIIQCITRPISVSTIKFPQILRSHAPTFLNNLKDFSSWMNPTQWVAVYLPAFLLGWFNLTFVASLGYLINFPVSQNVSSFSNPQQSPCFPAKTRKSQRPPRVLLSFLTYQFQGVSCVKSIMESSWDAPGQSILISLWTDFYIFIWQKSWKFLTKETPVHRFVYSQKSAPSKAWSDKQGELLTCQFSTLPIILSFMRVKSRTFLLLATWKVRVLPTLHHVKWAPARNSVKSTPLWFLSELPQYTFQSRSRLLILFL